MSPDVVAVIPSGRPLNANARGLYVPTAPYGSERKSNQIVVALERLVLVQHVCGLAGKIGGDNARDTGHVLLQNALNTHGERELTHGAAGASTLQLQRHHTVLVNTNVLEVTAIGLKVRANLVEDLLEIFFVNSCRDDVREARIRQERRLFQIEKEARGVIRSFNAKEEAARQAERDKKAKAKAAQRQRSDSKKAKTAQKPDAKLGTALSKRDQETKARQKAAEARKAKEAANRAKYELKQKKKAERIKAREEALAKRRAKEAAKAARGK